MFRTPSEVFDGLYELNEDEAKSYPRWRWEISWQRENGKTKTVEINHGDVSGIFGGVARSHLVYESDGSPKYLWLERVSINNANIIAFKSALANITRTVADHNTKVKELQKLRTELDAFTAPAAGFKKAIKTYSRDEDTDGSISGWQPLPEGVITLFDALNKIRNGTLRLNDVVQKFSDGTREITLIGVAGNEIDTEFAKAILAGNPAYKARVDEAERAHKSVADIDAQMKDLIAQREVATTKSL
jgi:hypothetical protein